MRVAIVGSRVCQNTVLDEIVRRIPDGATLIISGGARGVDAYAEQAAKKLALPFRKILPDYQRFGKFAPKRRNAEIIGQADRVLAFWDCQSRGTASVIALCIERRIPVEVFCFSLQEQAKEK